MQELKKRKSLVDMSRYDFTKYVFSYANSTCYCASVFQNKEKCMHAILQSCQKSDYEYMQRVLGFYEWQRVLNGFICR